jgi:hypothetical protein
MYDNSEQPLSDLKNAHWDNFLSPPLQSILPENFSSSVPDGAAFLTRGSSLMYPSCRQTVSLALFFKVSEQTLLVPLSVVICTKPSFGRDELDRDTL